MRATRAFEYRRKTLRARADRTTVRFYFKGQLVETHERKPPGGRSTKPHHFPPEKRIGDHRQRPRRTYERPPRRLPKA